MPPEEQYAEKPLWNCFAAVALYVPKWIKSLVFKRFQGIEKVHCNSIKITVDSWRRRGDFALAKPSPLAVDGSV